MGIRSNRRKSMPVRAKPASAGEAMGDVLCGRVRALRTKKGWTLEEMSAACDVSRSMLSEIERGREPHAGRGVSIAQAFGLSLDELIELPTVTHRLERHSARTTRVPISARIATAASARFLRCTWRRRSNFTKSCSTRAAR